MVLFPNQNKQKITKKKHSQISLKKINIEIKHSKEVLELEISWKNFLEVSKMTRSK